MTRRPARRWPRRLSWWVRLGWSSRGWAEVVRPRRAGWREVAATLGAVAALVALLVVGAEWYGNGWSNRGPVLADQGEGTLGLPLDTVMAWASLRSAGGGFEAIDTEGEPVEASEADEADGESMPSWMVELAVLDQEADAVGEAAAGRTEPWDAVWWY